MSEKVKSVTFFEEHLVCTVLDLLAEHRRSRADDCVRLLRLKKWVKIALGNVLSTINTISTLKTSLVSLAVFVTVVSASRAASVVLLRRNFSLLPGQVVF